MVKCACVHMSQREYFVFSLNFQFSSTGGYVDSEMDIASTQCETTHECLEGKVRANTITAFTVVKHRRRKIITTGDTQQNCLTFELLK